MFAYPYEVQVLPGLFDAKEPVQVGDDKDLVHVRACIREHDRARRIAQHQSLERAYQLRNAG